MKKKFTILFSIVCILVLAACGQTKANKEETKKVMSQKSLLCLFT
ncbi:iron ABC transporter substrate-binding protein [Bacillus anthracis]|nr:iron ABC transporter substrate-binding protein [Bacillus anthracis]